MKKVLEMLVGWKNLVEDNSLLLFVKGVRLVVQGNNKRNRIASKKEQLKKLEKLLSSQPS